MKPASITPRVWLVLVPGSERPIPNPTSAGDEVSQVNDRDVSAKEEGVLQPKSGSR